MKSERMMKRQYRPLWTAPPSSAGAAWHQQVMRTKTPVLAELLRARERELFPRFAAHYARLRHLPRRVRRRLQRAVSVSLAGAAMLLALGQTPGLAATIPVDGTTCTLLDALTAANTDTAAGGCPAGSGADVIELAPGSTHTLTTVHNSTYGDTGLPVITSDVTIEGQGATIQRDSTAPDFRLLAVGRGATLTLKETTVTGGQLLDSSISENQGGGLYASNATLNVIGSTISGNASGRLGGGLYAKHSTIDILDSAISGNTAIGGGLFLEDGDVTITNSVISGNTGTGVSLVTSSYPGPEEPTLAITTSVISGNDGSGVSASGSEYYVPNVTITESTISGNNGRGLSLSGAILAVTNSTISGNTTLGNTTPISGGGVSAGGVFGTFVNTTISGNSAGKNGGGVSGGSIGGASSQLTFDKSTITGNTSAEKGGGVDIDGGDLRLSHTLVSGNTALEGPELRVVGSGAVSADAHNLFGVNGEAGVVGVTPGPTDVVPATGVQLSDILNPTLADHGGSTQTHTLVPGSPAIDVIPATDSGCTGTDQRGVPRPQGEGCDIGAVELEQDQTTLPSTQDSFLQPQRQSANEGGHPFLDLGGQHRLVVGFDLSGVDLGQVAGARLVLTLDATTPPEGLGDAGALVGVHRLLAPWEEGNRASAGLPIPEKQRGTGAGVTWHCAVDADISNRDEDCADPWEGGLFDEAARADLVRHLDGMTGEVTFNVTEDVQAGADSWLLLKRGGKAGHLRYYAMDHPDVSINPNLAPRLVMTLL